MENQTPEAILSSQKPRSNFVLWIVVGIAILAVGIAIGLVVGKYSSKQNQLLAQPVVSSPIFSPTATPTETADPTANWKTYSGNGFMFKYPSSLTDLKDQGGVSGPWTGNPQSIINLGDNSTIHWGTDAPYDGFSVYLVSKLVSVSLLDYLNKEVETAKNSPRGIKSSTITETSLGGQAAAFIDNETVHREYFVSSLDGEKIVVFSRINSTDNFLNTFDQILSTFKFSTCKPRPACLDATPRCLIPETSDMCPPNQKL